MSTSLENQNRITELEHEHHLIEKQLGKMVKHPHAEESKVAELKKKKLQLKDEINKLQHGDSK